MMILDFLRPTYRNLREQFKDFKAEVVRFFRIQKQITPFYGPQFVRSKTKIEIDITYNCQLKCFNCNRSCGRAPSHQEMSLSTLESFISESKEQNLPWEQIRILGGEPTLHTRFYEMIELLRKYKNQDQKNLNLVVVSNGLGEFVQKRLAGLPDDVMVENTNKTSKVQHFVPFTMAPKDSFFYQNVDYTNGCSVIEACGMGLAPFGRYYPCAVAGGIDRIFGLNLGRTKAPSPNDNMEDLLRAFCPLCGHFRWARRTAQEKTSKTWRTAFQKFEKRRKTPL